MIKYLRKNNKKVMAIFGVGLMIAFAAQSRYGSGSGGPGSQVIGTIGTDQVTEGELVNARQEWRLLKQALVFEYPRQSGQYVSFLQYEFPPGQAIDQDARLYLLLLREADRAGVNASDQDVTEFLANQQLFIQMPSGSVTPFDQIASVDPDYAIDVKQALMDFLRVEKASNQALDLCKLSAPLKNYVLAEDHQNISVRLVEFDAKRVGKPAVPTMGDLQKQFDQFADLPPSGMGSETNPLGLGYQVPDEIKLQTISVRRGALKQAVLATKSAYDWDVAARSYYLKHKADYATSQPAGAQPPASAMVTLPTATTQPYDLVKTQVMDSVMAPAVDDLKDKVQAEITGRLASDWAAYRAAHPATEPTTAPTAGIALADAAAAAGVGAGASGAGSSLGVPYGSYEYFKALAAKVQKDLNVLPDTAAYNQPMASTDISQLPGIGRAHANGGAVSFMEAAMDPSLAVLAPSAVFSDDASNFYLFRVTERIAAHRPASMAGMTEQITADWYKSQAWQMALKRANDLRDAAAKNGLLKAASAAGELVINTAPFSASEAKASDAVPGLPLAGSDVILFREKCQAIMEAAAKGEAPVAVVEAPNESKVLVIELADVKPDWAAGERYVAEAGVNRELMQEFARPLVQDWFSLPGVEARLGFEDAVKRKVAG